MRHDQPVRATVERARDPVGGVRRRAHQGRDAEPLATGADERGALERNGAVLHVDIHAVKAGLRRDHRYVDRACLAQAHAQHQLAARELLLGRHSTLTPALSITAFQVRISRSMIAPYSAGVEATGRAPCGMRSSRTRGLAAALATSSRMRLTIAGGVRAGARKPKRYTMS